MSLAAGETTARTTVVTASLAGRSLLLIPRIPSTFVPSLVMPIFFTVAFGGAFSAVTRLPIFPTDQILNWIVPLSLLQGAAFAGITTGLSLARDVENGFFDRLLLSPVPRRALLLGPLVASALRAVSAIVAVLIVGFLGGARFTDAFWGPLILVAVSLGIAVMAGAWSLVLVFRFKSTRAAPLMQVGLFLVFFLSTAQMPLGLLQGWLHEVARINPMTNVLRTVRQGFLEGGVTWAETWPGVLAVAAGTTLLTLLAARGLKKMVP